jgi:hypothetical protein
VSKYVADRAYAEVYQVSGRGDIHSYLIAAVRGQLRYGSDWDRDHRLGTDVAGVDITMILGIDIDNDVIMGLDPMLYGLLPMGISFYTKVDQIERTKAENWHVWEKENRPGHRRSVPRSPTHLETFVGFTPERIIDYARFERRASGLRLEPPLRFKAAQEQAQGRDHQAPLGGVHVLEEQFALSSQQIMDIISNRNRLAVAVRGGVAEHHLEIALRANPAVRAVHPLDVDAKHDFDVVLTSGKLLRIECKNASPNRFSNGDFRVEVQKTRSSQGDPASRFYRADAYDVVAACMYSPTGAWDFRYATTKTLERHRGFSDRLAAIQRIDERWIQDLAALAS